jgi:DNA helicase-2/ATP-dependent DNA helicase PcrA
VKVELCERRKAILAQEGHLLVLGGPGSGKTTIALIKAKDRFQRLRPGQEVLFLSFSRAAIRQVVLRCKEMLTKLERRSVAIKTYHAFCLEVLESHGRLLRGIRVRFLYPGEERLRKSDFDGNWETERQRLAKTESLFCFDLLAPGVAELLERCAAVRRLIADKYPLIIVDEFQDTDNDQWRIVELLAGITDIFCLADPEQRIFDYRTDVDPRRIDILREHIQLTEFNLGEENHRSPNAGILQFADAVLRNHQPLPNTPDVNQLSYWNNGFAATVHAAVIWTFATLRQKCVTDLCVAVLCRSNALVADVSLILAEPHVFNGQSLPPVDHDVLWDAELSATAATVVATILEWPTEPARVSVARTLRTIAAYYKLKNAEDPRAVAAENARKYDAAALTVARGDNPRINAAKALLAAHVAGLAQVGDPVVDWREARRLLNTIPPLEELFREARLVRLFRATDALAAGLAKRWLDNASYVGASRIVKRVLDHERLIAADRDARGCVLMNMHKAKGKEFDGVVLVEGAFKSSFFDDRYEQPPYERSRRLLRVGITRARALVTIVRPRDARPLVD